MESGIQLGNDLHDEIECLELIAYEALAQRRAVLDKIREKIGISLEFSTNVDDATDLLVLHRFLLQRTNRCVKIIHQLEKLKHQMINMDQSSVGNELPRRKRRGVGPNRNKSYAL